jgi:hypothetical protein
MQIVTLQTLFNRDLNKLKVEIETYKNERNLWVVDKHITNSGGNLCLHLIGNLKTYIGANLGKTEYVRNRALEFSAKNVPRKEMVKQIEDTISIVDNTLENLDPLKLVEEYPILVFNDKMNTGYFLVHLLTHLGYHLGQINYHRRLLDQ